MNPPLTIRMGEPPFAPPAFRKGMLKHDRCRAILRYRFRKMAWEWSDPDAVEVSSGVYRALSECETNTEAGAGGCTLFGIRVFSRDNGLPGLVVHIYHANGASIISENAL